ncbi:MAG: HDIG domain-containing protein [Armatimonadetes bacterium]|nr:HDIG domain-containing protein [Armatimonadota bacterium]
MNFVKFFEKIFQGSKKVFQNKALIHILLFLFIFISLDFFIAFNYLPTEKLLIGAVSSKDIEAPQTVEFLNEQATRELKIKAASSVGIVYALDPFITSNQEKMAADTFELIRKIQLIQQLDEAKKIKQLKAKLPFTLSNQTLEALLMINPATLGQLEIFTKDLLTKMLHQGIKSENLKESKAAVEKITKRLPMPKIFQDSLAEIIKNALASNIVPNWEATSKLQQEKMSQVEPIKTVIQKGQIIVHKGEVVTPTHLKILNSLGIYRPILSILKLGGFSLFTLILIFLSLLFLAQQEPNIFFNDKKLFLLSIIVISTVSISKWLGYFFNYWTIVSTASILITILFNWRVSLLITSFLSVIIGISATDFYPIILSLITGVAAILSVVKVNKRKDLITGGTIIIIANILVVLIFSLIKNDGILQIFSNLIYGGINGIISVILAVGSLPMLENLFGLTTHIKLLELSNPQEPLLQRLLIETPGTYHHSILVSNLAQSAAQAIDADPLLARVGAYYHDIGKIKRPYFFIENQIQNENPHDKITPSLSTLIIISHVKDGLELARQYKLPEIVCDFITEHHGTNLVSYFYQQAKTLNQESAVLEEDFRYSGPKPKTKETAIVMLADIVEASARTLPNPNSLKIENLVKQTIKEALNDGQLDECELSFKNLNDLCLSFSTNLNSIYHSRMEYPEKFTQEIKRSKINKLLSFPKRK